MKRKLDNLRCWLGQIIERRKMNTLCYIVVFLKTSIECTTSKDFCTCHGRSLSSTLQIRWWKIGLETKFLRRISHIIEIYEIPTALFESTEGVRWNSPSIGLVSIWYTSDIYIQSEHCFGITELHRFSLVTALAKLQSW